MTFGIPDDKLQRLLEGARYLTDSRRVSVRSLALWVGLLQSCRLAISPLVSIMCRRLYDIIKSAQTWNSHVRLDASCLFCLNWWLTELPSLTEFDICPEPSLVQFSFSLASDASEGGYFVYKVDSKDKVISRPFTLQEAKESSTSCSS